MRISRPAMLMDICEVIARRSTCNRGNIGALIWDPSTKDIVSIGYNGAGTTEPHCHDAGCLMIEGREGCQRTWHAERNAMIRADKKLGNKKLHHMHLFCTSSPCLECAKAAFNYYLPRIYYRHPYRDKSGIEYFLDSSSYSQIFRVMPSGIILSERTGNIVDPKDIA